MALITSDCAVGHAQTVDIALGGGRRSFQPINETDREQAKQDPPPPAPPRAPDASRARFAGRIASIQADSRPTAWCVCVFDVAGEDGPATGRPGPDLLSHLPLVKPAAAVALTVARLPQNLIDAFVRQNGQ